LSRENQGVDDDVVVVVEEERNLANNEKNIVMFMTPDPAGIEIVCNNITTPQ